MRARQGPPAMREFAAMAFAMPQGCAEAEIAGQAVRLVLWKHGDSITLNMTRGQAEQALGALAEAMATYARGEAMARGEQPGPAEQAWPPVCPHCGERHLGRDWCGARKGVGSW